MAATSCKRMVSPSRSLLVMLMMVARMPPSSPLVVPPSHSRSRDCSVLRTGRAAMDKCHPTISRAPCQCQRRRRSDPRRFGVQSPDATSDDGPEKKAVDDNVSTKRPVENSDDDDDDERIFQMVEVSFINAIVQLSKGNVDFLKLFIISVKAGYERHIDPRGFVGAVDSLPTRAANRALLPEEIRLRTGSILAVYHALSYVGLPGGGGQGATPLLAGYDLVTTDLLVLLEVQKKDTGDDVAKMAPFDAHDFCRLRSDILPEMNTKLDAAVVSQTVRAIYYTLVVLEEQEQASRQEKGGDAAASTAAAPKGPQNPRAGKGFGKKN